VFLTVNLITLFPSNTTSKVELHEYYITCNLLLSTKIKILMKEGGFFMPINQNLFEEELDEFFNNLINSYLNYLSRRRNL